MFYMAVLNVSCNEVVRFAQRRQTSTR